MSLLWRLFARIASHHGIILVLLSIYLLLMARLHRLAQENNTISFTHFLKQNATKQTENTEHRNAPSNVTVSMKAPQRGESSHKKNGARTNVTNPFSDSPSKQNPSIYRKGNWDGAPIVVEEYNLVFFTQAKVACTVFKQLLRRMMHLEDWMIHKEPHLPHNPAKNDLRYLYHFHPDDAYHMMTSPDWTRAIFVRDPKERALSAYLDKAALRNGLHQPYVYRHCCIWDVNQTCAKKASKSFQDFIQVAKESCCCDPHWKPQSKRIDAPFWKYINFVGSFDSLANDTHLLLERLGGGEYAASGWGTHGNESIFAEGTSARHETSAYTKLRRYYNESGVEEMVEGFYAEDYANPLLNFNRNKIIQSP